MYISNATGCSSIWGNPGATNPYCTNAEGKGPAWCNSLFEDNAEHGFGMYLGQKAIRDSLIEKTKALIAVEWTNADLKAAAQKYLDTVNDLEANAAATKAYVAALEENVATVDELAQVPQFAEHAAELKAKGEKYCDCDACALGADILSKKDYLSKKSVWIFGGDGWAYDIGFGGVDHVLASGEDVNIFVFDTEVYSNTGGQASKASNIGQVAQFAAAGKETKSKSLAEIAMSYGYVYVAQVAMGANAAQTLKAIQEAEAYHGPSLIIGYAPCEMHSIKGGMQNCQKEMKKAVDCGYWNMFRFNPAAEKYGLAVDKDVMLIGIVSRLTKQKGFDLVAYVMEEMLSTMNVQFIVQGTGEQQYEEMFNYFHGRYPQKLGVYIGYSEENAHEIYAGCDAFLMPSLFEPCGLSQLMSMRYGTLPIVRETGGLKDTVVPYNEYENTGDGFSFANYNAHDMLHVIKYALDVFENHKDRWQEMMQRAMRHDFSWKASAKEYEKLYDMLLGN